MTVPLPLSVRLKTARRDRDVTEQIGEVGWRIAIPGGFASARISLTRPLDIQPDEIAYFGKVFIYDGRNGATLWEGLLEDPGRGAGDNGEVWSITATGPAAHTRDRMAPYILVDQSLERWVRSQYSEKSALTDPGEIDGDTPSLQVMATEGTAISATTPQWKGDWIYRALNFGGQKLARVRCNHVAGASTAAYQAGIYARTGAASGAFVDTANWTTGAGALGATYGSGGWVDGMDNVSIAGYRDSGAGSAVASAATWIQFYSVVVRAALKDASGVDITSGYSANTVTVAELVTDLLGRFLPLYDGPNAVINGSSTAIDQWAYPDGVTPAQAFEDLAVLEPGYYWAAWESGITSGLYRFEYVPWPTTIRYDATTLDGFDSPGSASDLYNAVTVRWKDFKGRVRSTTRTQTVQELTDAGITRTGFLDLSDDAGSVTAATRAGDNFLAEHRYPPNAGTLTVSRPILDNTRGGMVMPWELVPGGLIRVQGVLPRVDALNPSDRDGYTVFRVVSVEFNGSDGTATLELDSYVRTVQRQLAGLYRRRRWPRFG